VVLVLLSAVGLAYPSYTGYSGAPGTHGSCASTCHGTPGGTIQVTGFPAAYELSQTYVISVVHRGGSTLSNFNASVRTAGGSHTTGIITAGYLTATYNTGSEPNGVHLSSDNQDSCTFSWQAPDTAVGDVKLYLAGHQGLYGEANTDIVLTSSQMTGVRESARQPVGFALALKPTVANGLVRIRMSAPAGSHPSLRVIDCGGRLVARIGVPDAGQPITWQPLDRDGRRLPAGTFLVVLQENSERLVRKLVLK
jgi:hypothetical protein